MGPRLALTQGDVDVTENSVEVGDDFVVPEAPQDAIAHAGQESRSFGLVFGLIDVVTAVE